MHVANDAPEALVSTGGSVQESAVRAVDRAITSGAIVIDASLYTTTSSCWILKFAKQPEFHVHPYAHDTLAQSGVMELKVPLAPHGVTHV